MEGKIKLRLSLYGIMSAVSYVYLVMTPDPGISIFLFFVLQLAALAFILKDRRETLNFKGLMLMIPILVISLNRFISANHMLKDTNYLAIIFLYSAMILLLSDRLKLRMLNISEFIKVIANIFKPFTNFKVPIKWAEERAKNKEKNILVKRILIGIGISIPSVMFLTIMLSSADMIFYRGFISINNWFAELIDFFFIYKMAIGVFVGLYLFGHLFSVFDCGDANGFKNINKLASKKINGDIIVINIFLVSILAIYTLFMAIQFKYLFSSGEIPYGLNYSEYARRGFFELVFLSVLNIIIILLITNLLKDKIYFEKSKSAVVSKMFLIYLCLITGVLLVSSFYRMSLYDSAYGFTRLRILVYIFLIFEAIGLLATIVYIIKYNFNIFVVYALVILMFYMTLNIVRIDEIVAERNIDMYFAGQTDHLDIEYLMSLSADAVPQIMRLLDNDVEIITRNRARIYIEDVKKMYSDSDYSWRSINLPEESIKRLISENKDKIEFNY
ncbi:MULTISPECIES: DUF4153 domain-containing protein [unclassified Sedimentibacter]|uniref:DUF4153 domain-containing protein n=1 Tax=unclassified Sedimentibacter TaxID=2649220 RepID=UPI0027DFD1DF|nr:DUF4173 domain-containing protein [Sedimentibacter sp. MB35-C1]WMJ77655.1 DUF4173 domain-containing protein [Sedimentibacter sp. MB35-C1]